MSKKQVIVIGGGAAGLMAAGQAALSGAETIILEKKERPGRKLRITGKGRCNLTNNVPLAEFLKRFSAGDKFLRQAFARFFAPDLIEFLNSLKIVTALERGGRVFPADNDAKNLTESLVRWVQKSGVKILTDKSVDKLIIKDKQVIGVQVGPQHYNAEVVIIATGGASYPATGSTGDGYRLAKAAGHTIVPVRPSLVPVETAGDIAPRLQGLSLRNVKVTLIINGKKRDNRFGEMLFTHYGLSGPIILSLSRQIVDACRLKDKAVLSIDLKPALDEQKLDSRLLRDFEKNGKKKFQTVLKDLLPGKLIPFGWELTKIDPDKICSQISTKERKRLIRWLKDFQFSISDYRPFEEAIITAGGVSTKEINPRTMESRLVHGLYFAGEVIDIDADTGGFNLQAAFSTGWLAGLSATKN